MPPCRVERATLLGVVQQQIVIVQCPLLQGLPVQISLLKTNEDRTQSFSDKSRGLLQTSHSTEQSVFSSECVRVDTSNQLDTAEDCKQSDTPCDDQMHVESGKHSCDVCTKKSTRSDSFKRHMLNHTGERPFSCKVCNKKFRWPTNLKDHMIIHTSERPFRCKVCNKKFTQSSSLKHHMRMRIHSGEMSVVSGKHTHL